MWATVQSLARLKVPHDIAEQILNHKLPAMREAYDRRKSCAVNGCTPIA